MTSSSEPVRSQLRLPGDLYEQIKEAARLSGRSMNAEIVFRLFQSFQEHGLFAEPYSPGSATSRGITAARKRLQEDAMGAVSARLEALTEKVQLIANAMELGTQHPHQKPDREEMVGLMKDAGRALTLVQDATDKLKASGASAESVEGVTRRLNDVADFIEEMHRLFLESQPERPKES